MFKKIIIFLLFLTVLFPNVLRADGGFFFLPGSYMQEVQQKAVIFYDQDSKTETLILSSIVKGDPQEFAWVVPIPNKPEIQTASEKIFEQLAEYTKPKKLPNFNLGRMSASLGEGEGEVEIIETKEVGIYQSTTLTADNPLVLKNWLEKNNFQFSLQALPVFNDYIRRKWFFVVFRIKPEKLSQTDQRKIKEEGISSPIRFVFKAEEPVYPLKISKISGSLGPAFLDWEITDESPKFIPGKHGKAILLDEFHALKTDFADFDLGQGTIEFWFKPNDEEIKETLSKKSYDKNNFSSSLLTFITPLENIFELQYHGSIGPNNQNNSENFSLSLMTSRIKDEEYGGYIGVNARFNFDATNKIIHNTWNHFILTWDKDIDLTQIFLNGEEIKYTSGRHGYYRFYSVPISEAKFCNKGRLLNLKNIYPDIVQYYFKEKKQSKGQDLRSMQNYLGDFENPTPVSLLLDNQGLIQIDELRISKNSLQQKGIDQLYGQDYILIKNLVRNRVKNKIKINTDTPDLLDDELLIGKVDDFNLKNGVIAFQFKPLEKIIQAFKELAIVKYQYSVNAMSVPFIKFITSNGDYAELRYVVDESEDVFRTDALLILKFIIQKDTGDISEVDDYFNFQNSDKKLFFNTFDWNNFRLEWKYRPPNLPYIGENQNYRSAYLNGQAMDCFLPNNSLYSHVIGQLTSEAIRNGTDKNNIFLGSFSESTDVYVVIKDDLLVLIDQLIINNQKLFSKEDIYPADWLNRPQNEFMPVSLIKDYYNAGQVQVLEENVDTIFLSHFDDLIVTSDLANQFMNLNKIWRYEEDREEKDYYSSKQFSILLYLFGGYKYKNDSYNGARWGNIEYADWISAQTLHKMFKEAEEDLSIIKNKKYYLTKLFYGMDMSSENILAGMDQDWVFAKAEDNNPYPSSSSNRIARSQFWYILTVFFVFLVQFVIIAGPYLLLYTILFTPLILSFLWCRKILLKHSYSKFFLVSTSILFALWLGTVGFWFVINFKYWPMLIITTVVMFVNIALFFIPFVRSVLCVKRQDCQNLTKFFKITQIIILLLMFAPQVFFIRSILSNSYLLWRPLPYLLINLMIWVLFLWLFLRQNRQLKKLGLYHNED